MMLLLWKFWTTGDKRFSDQMYKYTLTSKQVPLSSCKRWRLDRVNNWYQLAFTMYISPILPHYSLDSSFSILPQLPVLIPLFALKLFDRKFRTLNFLIPRMPIPQIWYDNDPSPTPPWRGLCCLKCSQWQKWSSGLASTLLFGEKVGVFLMKKGLHWN